MLAITPHAIIELPDILPLPLRHYAAFSLSFSPLPPMLMPFCYANIADIIACYATISLFCRHAAAIDDFANFVIAAITSFSLFISRRIAIFRQLAGR